MNYLGTAFLVMLAGLSAQEDKKQSLSEQNEQIGSMHIICPDLEHEEEQAIVQERKKRYQAFLQRIKQNNHYRDTIIS